MRRATWLVLWCLFVWFLYCGACLCVILICVVLMSVVLMFWIDRCVDLYVALCVASFLCVGSSFCVVVADLDCWMVIHVVINM